MLNLFSLVGLAALLSPSPPSTTPFQSSVVSPQINEELIIQEALLNEAGITEKIFSSKVIEKDFVTNDFLLKEFPLETAGPALLPVPGCTGCNPGFAQVGSDVTIQCVIGWIQAGETKWSYYQVDIDMWLSTGLFWDNCNPTGNCATAKGGNPVTAHIDVTEIWLSGPTAPALEALSHAHADYDTEYYNVLENEDITELSQDHLGYDKETCGTTLSVTATLNYCSDTASVTATRTTTGCSGS